ncbi:MAG: thiamine phosphate synthase [Pseudomonadota bacterium]|uniref:thiamine phosphate synthase n=1 Tax=Thermithiobacillus tepidarius TaxID=929 RepID=UPI000409C07B|nr:thiamine phosphate synthase [Thermithiobacillus tepidarius]
MSERRARAHALIRGLYAITDAALMPPPAFAARAEAALRGGAQVLQYRDKSNDHDRRGREAVGLLSLCRQYGATLVINDDVHLARNIGAPAVHIGQGDTSVQEARALLGPEIIIGVTCHNSLELAIAAQLAGADYVAFGAFHPSPSKPDTVLATPDLLRAAKKQLSLPVVAIGGITPQTGSFLLRAGADALAVISGVFAAPDVEAAARRYARLFG